MGTHTGLTSHWVETVDVDQKSSMGTHTGQIIKVGQCSSGTLFPIS